MKNQKQRIRDLAEEILLHKKLYYAGNPKISDAQYDRLEDELRSVAPDHPVLSFVGTESQRSDLERVQHNPPMLSLSKTYDMNELVAWAEKREIVGTLKVDGVSVSLVYTNGVLTLAKTRGNGRIGENATEKLRWVADTFILDEREDVFEVRGELSCSETAFIQLAKEMSRLGLEKPSSPRNIVAGILGRKEHIELARYFSFFAFEVISAKPLGFKTELEKFRWLEQRGFRLPEPQLIRNPTELQTYLDFAKSVLEKDEYGIDGAVFSFNDLQLHEELGTTSHHPRYKMSFKWKGETATSIVRDITWSTSRLGVVTPVAVIDPIILSGAQITNVTLHNAAHVRSYQLKPGDLIEVIRSGEVIPKFLRVVKPGPGTCLLPDRCNSCGSTLADDDIRLICTNPLCSAQRVGMILNWIQCVGIEDLSEKRLAQMIDVLKVQSITDLYRLSESDLLRLPATKVKMARKLFDNINNSRILPLPVFLHGLGIEGAGLTTWEKIVDTYETLDDVLAIDASTLASIPGFAEKSSAQIVEGLQARKELIKCLIEAGVVPQTKPRPNTNGSLAGKQFVITGALSRPRAEVERSIKEAGGKVASAVSQHTFAVITNEPHTNSSKMKKARTLGTRIWTEGELLKQIDSGTK